MFIGDLFLKTSGFSNLQIKEQKILPFGFIVWTEVQSDIDILSSKAYSLLMSYQMFLLCCIRWEKKKVLHEKTRGKTRNDKSMKT